MLILKHQLIQANQTLQRLTAFYRRCSCSHRLDLHQCIDVTFFLPDAQNPPQRRCDDSEADGIHAGGKALLVSLAAKQHHGAALPAPLGRVWAGKSGPGGWPRLRVKRRLTGTAGSALRRPARPLADDSEPPPAPPAATPPGAATQGSRCAPDYLPRCPRSPARGRQPGDEEEDGKQGTLGRRHHCPTAGKRLRTWPRGDEAPSGCSGAIYRGGAGRGGSASARRALSRTPRGAAGSESRWDARLHRTRGTAVGRESDSCVRIAAQIQAAAAGREQRAPGNSRASLPSGAASACSLQAWLCPSQRCPAGSASSSATAVCFLLADS